MRKVVVEDPSGCLMWIRDEQIEGKASILCTQCGWHGYFKDVKVRTEFPEVNEP